VAKWWCRGITSFAAIHGAVPSLGRLPFPAGAGVGSNAHYDPEAPERALALFDFSQNLVDLWRRSNSEVKREIPSCVSLNRTILDVSLYVAKRRPFDFLAEKAFLAQWRPYRNLNRKTRRRAM
jgi:hypothetical protein